MNVYPTHSCFDDAFELIEQILINNLDIVNQLKVQLILVHAICRMPDGKLYAHAWVEDKKNNTCMFIGIIEGKKEYLRVSKDEYYKEMMPHEFTKYTVAEAVEQNLKHVTTGPWIPAYKALCRLRRTKKGG